MPRLPRIYVEGSLYYVTCKSLPSLNIFKDKEDYEMYFGLLKKYKEELGVKIYAYTLLPNHLHLLLETDANTSISTIMHNLNSSYTKYYNGRYSRKGHLFRERFKAALIEKDLKLLLNFSAHIHLNSKRLNLGIEAQTYPYSSYGLYLDYTQQNDRGLDIKDQISQVISALVGENYAEFVEKLSSTDEYKKLHKKLSRKHIVGSDEFMKKAKEKIEEYKKLHGTEDLNEESVKSSSLIFGKPTAVLIIVLAAAGVYLYFNFTQPKIKPVDNNEVKSQQVDNNKFSPFKQLEGLDRTQWQIRLTELNGNLTKTDLISFNEGKILSVYLSQFNYSKSNYSAVVEADKMTWETMQTSPQGTASWRGEVKEGRMSGVLSLRWKGKKPQYFSFKSIRVMRK